MNSKYDVVVIGSGFGGAVAACRLAEKGMRVLVLERGRRWQPGQYPRDAANDWIWDSCSPHSQNGWADIRVSRHMSVITGAGVGGGSLIYANVSVKPDKSVFEVGWPREISYEALEKYLDVVGEMLDVREVPIAQLSARARLLREAAEAAGWGDRVRNLPVAVSFDASWKPEDPDSYSRNRSVPFTNRFGRQQGTCIHCGECDIGCQVSAKNTLDLNYLARAEALGAEIRPLHFVTCLEQDQLAGWVVHYQDLSKGAGHKGSVVGDRVVLGAGSIGSTELLLRCRDLHGTLPKISSRLGYAWSFNGDFVTPAHYPEREIAPSRGITIALAIDLLDRSHRGQALFIEEGGIPSLSKVLSNLSKKMVRLGASRRAIHSVREALEAHTNSTMPWFGQAVDAGDGQLRLSRRWYAPWRSVLDIRWLPKKSEPAIEALVDAHMKLSQITGGVPKVPSYWKKLRHVITPHPLGGCGMGSTVEDGVTDHSGRVFGYRDLYVLDGACIPTPIGKNPSRTIAAIAERNVELIT